MAKKIAVKKVNMKSPEFQKESKRMDRKPKASGRADFDPTGMLLGAGAAGVKVLTGYGFGAGGVNRNIPVKKYTAPKPGGSEPPSMEEYKAKPKTGLATKTPKKLVGKPIRKPIVKKK